MRCAKNGTTAFAPVPDSIVLMLLSQVTLRFVLVTFQNLYYYAYNNYGIVYFIFHFKSLSIMTGMADFLKKKVIDD